MITALSLTDRNGTDVALMRSDEKVIPTAIDGLWGVESPRQVKRPRPTGHGSLNDTKYGDGRLASIAFECIGTDYADTLAQFRTVTAPMVETWDYGAALLKWTEGIDARQGLTNLPTNPSFENGLTGWTALGPPPTSEVIAAHVVSGTNAYHMVSRVLAATQQDSLGTATGTNGFPVVGGTSYVASVPVDILAQAGSTRFYIQVNWYTAAGAFISANTGDLLTTVANNQRSTIIGSSPANAAFAAVLLVANCPTAGASGAIEFYADAVQFYAGSTLRAYWDGDTEWAYWTGTPHASTSVFDHSLQRAVKLDSDVTPQIVGGNDRVLAFQAQFFAEDPRAYHQDQRTVSSSPLSTASGGMVFPLRFPFKFTPSGGGTVAVTNRGNRKTPPVFRVYGMCVNPAIINVATGEQITINGTIATGDFLEVGTDASGQRYAKYNGTQLQNDLIDPSNTTWFELPRGTSNLQMVSGTFDGSARLDVLLRDAYA